MPFLKKYRTKKYVKRRRVYRKKRMFKKPFNRGFKRVIKFNPSRSLKSPFPEVYRTVLFSQIQGYVPTSTSLPLRCTVSTNDIVTPWNAAGAFSGFVSWPNTLQAIAVTPIGTQQLLSQNQSFTGTIGGGIYRNCQVNAYKVALTCNPDALNDNIQVTTYPCPLVNGILPSNSAGLPTDANAAEVRYSKVMLTNSTKLTTMKTFHKIRDLYGLSKLQYSASKSTIGLTSQVGTFAMSAAVGPRNQAYQNFIIQSGSAATQSTSIINYTVKMWQYVEFFNPVSHNIPVA